MSFKRRFCSLRALEVKINVGTRTMKAIGILIALTALATIGMIPTHAADNPVPVTVDNFVRAETDRAFAGEVALGGFAKLRHRREPVALDQQTVPRINRDTLYSSGVFDLDAGPVTITMPDAGQRFMSLMVIDEDHYVHGVYYGPGTHTFSKNDIGSRYMLVALRTLFDPQNPSDIEAVHGLQDASHVQQSSSGSFEVPNWNEADRKKIRDALIVLNSTLPDLRRAFGSRAEVDPVRHLIGTATAWGGNPDKDALYLNVTPARNDGRTVYRLNVKDVPVDAFWSVTAYDGAGYLRPNKLEAYNVNSLSGKKEADGSIGVQFGGCGSETSNCIPIVKDWNYIVRLYRPRSEILDGTWTFPEAQPIR